MACDKMLFVRASLVRTIPYGQDGVQCTTKDIRAIECLFFMKEGAFLTDIAVQDLREDVREIKSDVKDVGLSVNALRVLIAENYVPRSEFEDYKKEEKINRRWWAGFIIAAASFITTILKTINF